MAWQPNQDWLHANQRHLAAAVTTVRRFLPSRDSDRPLDATVEAGGNPHIHDGTSQLAEGMSRPPALETLCQTFGLTEFERAIVVMCAGAELDGNFPAVPTFGLALATLPGAHWSALLPNSPVRHWHLIDFGAGGSPRAERLDHDASGAHRRENPPLPHGSDTHGRAARRAGRRPRGRAERRPFALGHRRARRGRVDTARGFVGAAGGGVVWNRSGERACHRGGCRACPRMATLSVERAIPAIDADRDALVQPVVGPRGSSRRGGPRDRMRRQPFTLASRPAP